MDKLTDQTKETFFRLINDDFSVNDFGQWVHKHSGNLEKELPAKLYYDLISFDYNQKDLLAQLKGKIKKWLDRNEFNLWRTKKLLTEIIEQKIDLVLATRKLHTLYYDTGETFIPITLAIGYCSELDDLPIPSEYKLWDSVALKEKLKKVDLYRDDIIRDAKEFLATLNKTTNSGKGHT
jgi:hypothetical protein